jgi:hypothetical protein
MPVMERVAILIPVYNPSFKQIQDLFEDLTSQGNLSLHVYLAVERTELEFDLLGLFDKYATTQSNVAVSFNFFEGRLGIGHALFNTINVIEERIVIRHDIGDRMLAGRISCALQAHLLDPSVSIAYSDALLRDVEGMRRSRCPVDLNGLKMKLAVRNPIIHPTVSFNLDELKRLNLNYDPDLRFCEDLDLWLRALQVGAKFLFLEGVNVVYDKPVTVRPTSNWRANLFVRLRNFPSPSVWLSLLGVLVIAIFLLMPLSVREAIYRAR